MLHICTSAHPKSEMCRSLTWTLCTPGLSIFCHAHIRAVHICSGVWFWKKGGCLPKLGTLRPILTVLQGSTQHITNHDLLSVCIVLCVALLLNGWQISEHQIFSKEHSRTIHFLHDVIDYALWRVMTHETKSFIFVAKWWRSTREYCPCDVVDW